MAAPLQICVFVVLTASPGWAAVASGDETCLVQRDVQQGHDVVLLQQAVEKPFLHAMSLWSKVKTAPLPSGLVDVFGNISLQTVRTISREALRMIKNETIMEMLESAIDEVTTHVGVFSIRLRANATTLSLALQDADATSSSGLLRRFLQSQAEEIVRISSEVLMKLRDRLDSLPSGLLKTSAGPLLDLLHPFTRQSLYGYLYGDIMEEHINYMFSERSTLCSLFMQLHANFSAIDVFVDSRADGLFKQARSMVSPLTPIIQSLDESAAPIILSFVDRTLASSEGMIKALGASFHDAVVVMGECVRSKIKCKDPKEPAPEKESERSAAASRALWLAAAAASAAAWAALAM